jgi:hypothetical protein
LNRRLDTIEHSHREAEGNIQSMTTHLSDLSLRHTATDARIQQAEDKIKVGAQTVRDLSVQVASLPTTEDVASVRRDLNDKVCFVCFCSLLFFLRFAYKSMLCIIVYVSDS